MRELPGALAREPQQLLRACAVGELGLALQLREQRDRRRVLVPVHGGARRGHELLQLLVGQRRIASHALDGRRGHLRHGGVRIARDSVVADREPGPRVARQREIHEAIGLRAAVDRTHAQPVPLLAVDHRLGDERRRLEQLVRTLDIRLTEGLGLRVEIDREVGDLLGGLPDEDLAAAACAVNEAQPQPAGIDALRQDVALVLPETEREGDLPRSHGFDARGGDDARAAGHRRCLGRDLRHRAHAAVCERRELDVHLFALARRETRDVAHRAVEHHGEVDLVLVVVHLDHVHQAPHAGEGCLREGPGRAERGQGSEGEPTEPALNA